MVWVSTYRAIEERPYWNIKLTYESTALKWKLIYDTWNWYLIQFEDSIKLIPYSKIEYLGLDKYKTGNK